MTQAIVAVGGRATRLRGSVPVPLSKPFLPLRGRPLLHWCLVALQEAGIDRLIIAGDHLGLLDKACEQAAVVGGWRLIEPYLDQGLGVHGLPYHVGRLIDGPTVFQAGHAVTSMGHTRALLRAHSPGTVVFTAHPALEANPRPGIPGWGFALPMVVDRDYANALPSLGFDVRQVIERYPSKYVATFDPPEFDTPSEHSLAMSAYGASLQ